MTEFRGYSTSTGFCIQDENGIWVESNNLSLNMKNIKEAEEWHAVEHKLIWVLENGRELTIENLKKAPTESRSCFYYNSFREPSDEKLLEGLQVGTIYLKAKQIYLKERQK